MFRLNRVDFFFLLLIFRSVFGDRDPKTGQRKTLERNVADREFGYFWHLTDVLFHPNSNSSPQASPGDDRHVENGSNVFQNCGFFGEPGKCSAVGLLDTIASVVNTTSWKNGPPDFSIFTGNFLCPNFGDPPEAVHENTSAFIKDIWNVGFFNVYSSYGWHDFRRYNGHRYSVNLTRNPQLDWMNKKSPNQLETRRKLLQSSFDISEPRMGFYSDVLQPKKRIRVIVINTNFYVKNHAASRTRDPAGQWKWLIRELRMCRTSGQKAFIVMSIPPGTQIIQRQNQRRNQNDGKPSGIRVRKITDETPNLQIQESDFVWNNLHNLKYVEVINEFHDIIAGQFAGQRHEDSFIIVYDKRGKPVSSVLLAPAINPRFESYPAMRIYMYDKNSGELVDFLQYYLNLTKANFECNKNEGEKYWNIGYSFRDYYRLPDATTKSLEKLVQNFGKDDYLFQRYRAKAEGFKEGFKTTRNNDRCKSISLCAITNLDRAKFLECVSKASVACATRKNFVSIKEFNASPEALRDRLIHRLLHPISGSAPLHPTPSTIHSHLIKIILLYSFFLQR